QADTDDLYPAAEHLRRGRALKRMCRVSRHWQEGIGALHGRLLLLRGHRKRVKSGRGPKLWLPGVAGSNPYEAPICQETNYPYERIFLLFFRLWIPGAVSRRSCALT